jgi:hypothetical protein
MDTSFLTARATSLNAKVGAITLASAAFLTLLLSHFSQPLAPLRLLALAIAAFAAWSFCDEMGMRKPLNRAGFVFFAMAVAAKAQIVVGVAIEFAGRYYLLYTAFLLAALLAWSVAFLHRQRTLKMLGAVGALASAAPLVALVIGHVALGTGAALGVGAILSAAEGTAPTDLGFVTLIERMFGLWAYFAAWLLWRGHIHSPSLPREA